MYEYLSNKELQQKIISTDTDSIFLKNYAGEIKTSDKLGDMKLETGYPVNVGVFVRPKMYSTIKPKCKGVKFPRDLNLANEEFNNILKGQTITQERFIKYRSAVNSKQHHKNGVLKPNQIITINKDLNLEDTKRVWGDDFNPEKEQTSVPIVLNHILERGNSENT